MVEHYAELFIGGEWVPPTTGRSLEVVDPATGSTFSTAPAAGAEDAQRAIDAASRAYRSEWSEWDGFERAVALRELADVLDAHADEVSELETRENGKPLHESRRDVEAGVEALRYYAGAAEKYSGKTLPDQGDVMDLVVNEPYGVVGTIIPWNWPAMHVCDFLAPVLAAGNTLVLKPAPGTPLCALRMAELFEESVPDGVINVVTGAAEPGRELTRNPAVDKLAFTGNAETGAAVLEAAGRNITSTMLELGGKNACIVFDDADVEEAADAMIAGCFYNTGEACSSAERLLLHRDVRDSFLEAFLERTADLVVGPGRDPETDLGPLTSERQFEKVTGYIEIGRRSDATLRYADEYGREGFFVGPHVFDEVTPEMRLFSEEVFGPVVSVTTFETEREAIELANAVEYGLTGAVWSGDAKRAMRVARALDVGFTLVNTYYRGGIGAPFGGFGRSGIGRKYAFEETMAEFTRVKTIRYNTGSSPDW